MTQSKDDDITITIANDLQNSIDDSIVIDLSNTYGATTTYIADNNYTINLSDTISITDGTFTIDTAGIDWIYNKVNVDINPNEVERMCKEYPGLEKVWRNFKSVYDMCKQDYEGKKKAGELDDDIPF